MPAAKKPETRLAIIVGGRAVHTIPVGLDPEAAAERAANLAAFHATKTDLAVEITSFTHVA